MYYYLLVYGLEAPAITFSVAFSYLYLTLITEIQRELKKEIPRLYYKGFWFTKDEAAEMKKRINKRFWSHITKKLRQFRRG